jgi:hypothetical protein
MFKKKKKKECGECSRLACRALANSTGVVAYVVAVSWLLMNGDEFFGNGSRGVEIFGLALFLTLLVLSVAIVGSLIFGKPILLYLDGKKREGIKLLIWTLIIMSFFTFGIMSMMIVS